MEQTKNLCAQIPISLYTQVTEGKDASGLPLREYVTAVLTEYYMMKGTGGNTMENKSKTLAFKIDEELYQRIKTHLARESARTGKKLTQQGFVLDLIEKALQQSELQAMEEAVGSPAEADPTEPT